MAQQDDVLSREVGIVAKLEENGVALRARSRTVAALDRLAGSFFDMPAAFFEGVSRKKRLRDEINERLRTAQSQVAEQQIGMSPNLGKMLIQDVLEEKARKQINAASVAVEAIDAIKTLPPFDHVSNNDPAQGVNENIDEDWMNQFVRYAEDASSEQLQQVWGRVLAGELVKPGTFSRHTLRFFAELDKETARNCELIGHNVINTWVFKDEGWNIGDQYLISIELQQLGIMEGVATVGPHQKFTINMNGICGIAGKSWGLYISGKPETKLTIPVYVLTRMGQEVISILNISNEEATLRKISERLNKTELKTISLAKVISQFGDKTNFDLLDMELLWQATI